MLRIVISYRRADSSAYSGRLHDALRARLADADVFMDIDNLEPGTDFVDSINSAIGHCDFLLAVIGPRWAAVADASGRSRLRAADDHVRIEIETALKLGRRVIPVLVGHAEMPASAELPESLAALPRLHAVELDDSRWGADVERLLAVLLRAHPMTAVGVTGAESGAIALATSGARGTDPSDARRVQRGGTSWRHSRRFPQARRRSLLRVGAVGVALAVLAAATIVAFGLLPPASRSTTRSSLQGDVGIVGPSGPDTPTRRSVRKGISAAAAARKTLATLDAPIAYQLNGTTITPAVPYLRLIRVGGPVGGVEPLDFEYWASAENFPRLDVKLANTGTSAVLLTGASVHVGRSAPDLEPIPIFYRGDPESPGTFDIANEGWGSMKSIAVAYDVRQGLGETTREVKYPFHARLDASGSVDVGAGIAAQHLAQVGQATVWGSLSYVWRDSAGLQHAQHVHFVTTVYLAQQSPLVGAAPPFLGNYDVALHVKGRNYDVPLRSFDRFIKAQEPDRFTIRVVAPRSSIHTGVQVRLRFSDGHVKTLGPLTLRIFLPRNAPLAQR